VSLVSSDCVWFRDAVDELFGLQNPKFNKWSSKLFEGVEVGKDTPSYATALRRLASFLIFSAKHLAITAIAAWRSSSVPHLRSSATKSKSLAAFDKPRLEVRITSSPKDNSDASDGAFRWARSSRLAIAACKCTRPTFLDVDRGRQ
jgi:hypothetical protein